MTEACKLGLVNVSFSDKDAKNGSTFISPLLYYYVSPILNMDVLTNEEEMNMTGSMQRVVEFHGVVGKNQ